MEIITSVQPGSLTTVVKIGAHGRPFQLRDRVFLEKQPDEDEKGFKKRADKAQAIERPFFDQTLAPGTAVIMTLETQDNMHLQNLEYVADHN